MGVQILNQPTSQEGDEIKKEEDEEEEGDEESAYGSEKQVQAATITNIDCDNDNATREKVSAM